MSLIISRLMMLGSIPLISLMMLCGCRSVQLAPDTGSASSTTNVSRSSSASSNLPTETLSRWPTRWGNNPDHPGTIIDLDPTEPLRPIHLSRFHQFRSTDIEYADANQLAADIGITTGFKFKSEGPGSFLFIPNPTNKPNPDITQDSGTLSKTNTPDLAFKFVSAIQLKDIQRDAIQTQEDFVEIQRTWFTYQDSMNHDSNEHSRTDDAKGTIIILPGMFGTPDPIIDAMQRFWHKQGYAVLRMRSQPSRFTEHEMVAVIAGEESIIAIRAAALFDNGVAEGAYATKAAIDHLFTLRPNLKDKPTILIGMSAGAIMLPTVYAYAPEYYNGAIMIAGGADFIRIAIESNYISWIDSIVFDFKPDDDTKTGSPTDDQLETLSKHYLKASKLDAYHTANELTDIPVLMLHAANDKAVPSSTGRLLYQQLGEPERWSYPLGHELIFLGLPTQVSRIDRWITEHVISPDDD